MTTIQTNSKLAAKELKDDFWNGLEMDRRQSNKKKSMKQPTYYQQTEKSEQ